MNKVPQLCLIAAILTAFSLAPHNDPVETAATPGEWQQSSTGLRTQQNAEKKTAGLVVAVQDRGWPFLSLQGGVKEFEGRLITSNGVDLGLVQVPNLQGGLTGESTDWSHNEMSFNSSALKLWASRLTPAVLLQISANALQLLAGNVASYSFNGAVVTSRGMAPSWPKFAAYSSGGAIQIVGLSGSSIALPSLDQNWMLMWYGGNSHFVETRKPLTYSEESGGTLPQRYAYQADAPILIVFENNPTSIAQSAGGGVELKFPSNAGYLAMLPLFGREHPSAGDTDGWVAGLPTGVVSRLQFWAPRIRKFPLTATESYSYDVSSDTAIVTEQITFLEAIGGGVAFAPIPSMLAVAKDNVGVSFSGTVVNGNLPTEFGPTLGIENVNNYTWSLQGLGKYADQRRKIENYGSPPSELLEMVNSQVDSLVASGHFSPWIFTDHVPTTMNQGDIYWLNPADILYHLAEVVPILSDPQRASLIQYLKNIRAAYPPETVYNLPLDVGTQRSFQLPTGLNIYGETLARLWTRSRSDAFLKRVPLFSFYALSRYYDTTGEPIPASVLSAAGAALDNDMREQDWATFYWFRGYEDRRIAVENANRHLAGLVGLVRIAEQSGVTATEQLARVLLAKAAILRVGLAEYPQYLYSVGLVELPPEPDWQPRYSAGAWIGHVFDYGWTSPADDSRQVSLLNQFAVFLYDHAGLMEPGTAYRDWVKGPCSARLSALRDVVPELGRLLSDYAREHVDTFISKYTAFLPGWYAAFAQGVLGAEHNLSHPIDSFQIFMGKALMQHEPAEDLMMYIDTPWNLAGDLFYISKVTETIKAYRGWTWDNPR